MASFEQNFTAFVGYRRVASGPLSRVAIAVLHAMAGDSNVSALVFSDETGAQIDLDLRGSESDVLSRLPGPATAETGQAPPRGRGRPRLGVTAREVTLLPEHWDWLASQPGGASVALRKLVHQARKATSAAVDSKKALDRAYAFMAAVAGNLPGFEEASRALFAADQEKLAALSANWPQDVREYVIQLANPGDESPRAPPH